VPGAPSFAPLAKGGLSSAARPHSSPHPRTLISNETLGGVERRNGESPVLIPNNKPGPYTLQAAIAACHARAATPDATDWPRIATLYATLAQTTPSPIIELNRAVAVSMTQGPQAGLDIVDTLTNEPTLKNYHLLPSVRGDLLAKLNRPTEARTEFERAATLTRNTRERDLLLKRAKDCAQSIHSE